MFDALTAYELDNGTLLKNLKLNSLLTFSPVI